MAKTTSVLDRPTALRYRSLKDLKGYRVLASDGEIGRVADFYFDDTTWTLRYFVVETGGWLNKRPVLLSPKAFAESDGGPSMTISTNLTRKQIENAPHADLAKPVSRRFELKLHEYFAWPVYWPTENDSRERGARDPHLRSVAEVLGYGIRAKDGNIGHVEDLIVDENSWVIRHLAIDTRNWLPGRKVLVSPLWIDNVSWSDSKVTVDLTLDEIKASPEYDPRQPVNRAYEERLFDYYGRPKYWV